MNNPWRVIGSALAASLLVVIVLNAQFFWLTLRHELTPDLSPEPEPVSAVAQSPAVLPDGARGLTTVGISNVNLAKIPIGVVPGVTPDADNDGLSDALENVLGTNPKSIDTDGDRVSDSSELLLNRNPNGKGSLPVDLKFADKQKGKYLLQVESRGELWYVNPTNARRYYVTGISAPVAAAAVTSSQANRQSANTLVISSLNLDVPVVYVTQATEKAFQEGLKYGVVHYPGTARPGELGNVYIFGHSSDYRWSGGKFKTVFAVLPDIKVGADILLTDAGGQVYKYKVLDKKVVLPTETKYLQQYEYKRKVLTLQTSWPIGTALKRYVVIAELIEE